MVPHIDEDGKIHVVVDNVHEIGVAAVEEKEPEHFSIATFTIAGGQPTDVRANQILPLDPDRKDAWIIAIDAPFVLCDSVAQASASQNQVTGIPAPAGGYVPQLQEIHVTGTGALWAATPVATRITVITNRRGS